LVLAGATANISLMNRNDDPYLTGQLLIAMPAMEDPRFAQSVILLCAHTNEGAMGIVLNRPLAKPTFEALLTQLDVQPTPPARQMQENVWLSAPAPVELLFDADYDTKWRRALGILHIDPLLLSGAAGHA